MNKNWNNFCALAVFFLTFSLKSQAQSTDSVIKLTRAPQLSLPFFPSVSTQSSIFFTKENSVRLNWGNPFSNWGVMCIGEYKLEKKTGIPFRFRLGSLEYVNKLEGKK